MSEAARLYILEKLDFSGIIAFPFSNNALEYIRNYKRDGYAPKYRFHLIELTDSSEIEKMDGAKLSGDDMRLTVYGYDFEWCRTNRKELEKVWHIRIEGNGKPEEILAYELCFVGEV